MILIFILVQYSKHALSRFHTKHSLFSPSGLPITTFFATIKNNHIHKSYSHVTNCQIQIIETSTSYFLRPPATLYSRVTVVLFRRRLRKSSHHYKNTIQYGNNSSEVHQQGLCPILSQTRTLKERQLL